jgi:ElaB/YqjD/DUF883 family membrane-anchored ribosome-binding protein
MPKFQARYFTDDDESIPCRVDPVEGPDHASALQRARSTMRVDEVRVELIDTDDELRRGTPHHGAGNSSASAAGLFGGWLSEAEGLFGYAVDMVQDRTEKALESAGAATEEVRTFVRTKPYAAIGIAAALAYVIGLHVGAGQKRVIYLKPDRHS